MTVTTVRPVKGVGWNVFQDVGGVEKSLALFQRKADAVAEAQALHEMAFAFWELALTASSEPVLLLAEDVEDGTA